MGNETKNSCKDGHVFLGAARARFRSTSKCRIKSIGRLQQALCSGLEPGVNKLPGIGTLKTHERLRRWLHSSSKKEAHAGRMHMKPTITSHTHGYKDWLGNRLKQEQISVLGLLSRTM